MKECFEQFSFLWCGSDKQTKTIKAIEVLNIMEQFKSYDPVIAGTIPLDIDIENSDIDIICSVYESHDFETKLIRSFHSFDNFHIETKVVNSLVRTVCSFDYDSLRFEFFGQPVPSRDQNAYRHMLIEGRILERVGRKGNEVIRTYKRLGLKTEPAFGKYLGIRGDSYEALLSMYYWSDLQLEEFLNERSVVV